MSNVYKFCGCRGCRQSKRACHKYTQNTMRKFRRLTKQALMQGKEPPTKISIPYTD